MKKNRITDSLNQELRGVRVSPELRRRILANARSERFRRRRRNASALSAIAAVLVVALMVVGGLKVLRKPAPDRKYVQGDTAAVWIDEVDRTYHSKRGCSEHNMRIVPASEARARGFTACRKCIPILKTPEPTPDATEAPAEITPEPTPVATEAPVEITPEVTPDASLEVTPTVSVTIEPNPRRLPITRQWTRKQPPPARSRLFRPLRLRTIRYSFPLSKRNTIWIPRTLPEIASPCCGRRRC